METQYATIANTAQALVCDNRLCDIRSDVVQGRMDRERIIAFMESRELDNRKLADLLGISEDKVSKSLSLKVKPRQWQGPEVLKLVSLMRDDELVVKTEVKGTGMSPSEVRDAWAMAGNVKPVPLLGTAMGGDWEGLADVELTELRLSEVLDYLARPPSLAADPEAYAVEITGTSMNPRFEPGERAFVSPKSPVRIGDDVIVQLKQAHPEGSDFTDTVTAVLIKRLVKRNAEYIELRQFNPDQTFRVPIGSIASVGGKLAIHRVRGRL
jgi:hypothetical protein